jgi:hypothetical protein
VKSRFEVEFKMPLLSGYLDTSTRLYASLGSQGGRSMTMVFAAELARRIRSKDATRAFKHYLPLVRKARDEETQFVDWAEKAILFPSTIHDVN